MAQAQRTVLRRFADEGDCILKGRCADYYLAGREDVLSVFVIDNEENCLSRIMEYYPELTEKEAKKLIRKTDKRRQDYYAFFTGKRWGDPSNYSLYLNCAMLGGADLAARMLAAAVRSSCQEE